MEIREFANGGFQVWSELNQVLRPATLEWEDSYQSQHSFMYFNTYDKALQASRDVLRKVEGEKIVNVTKLNKGEMV